MIRTLLLLPWLFVAALAAAQGTGPGDTGINASLLNLFGEVDAFTAKADVQVSDKNGKEISSIPVNMWLLGGKLRAEMDMTQMRGGAIPAEAAAMLKNTGMDRMQLLIGGSNQTSLVIYPGLQAYAPVPDSSAVAKGKVETAELGKETLDGHPCTKQKLTITDEKGKAQEAVIWSATDLKGFPLLVETKQSRNTIRFHFNKPVFAKPDARLFEVPAGYKKHDSIEGLMQAAMLKMLGIGK